VSVSVLTGRCSEASPRFSAYEIRPSARVCGGTMSTTNVGHHAPTCPLFVLRCVRGTHCHKIDKHARSGCVRRFVP
jgi:hypothetical protein